MRIHTLVAAAAVAAGLSGCYTYPVYQPVPVARLTPQQSAALANSPPPSQADQDRMARDNAQVAAQQDQTAQSYAYAYPTAPVYSSPYPYYADSYYGYPYYGYPYAGYYGGFYPSISLGFGFGGYYGRGGYRGWHGGGGGWHGGGGGFHGHR